MMLSSCNHFSQSFSPDQILVVVPYYNHPDTLAEVVTGIQQYHSHILVVDDGSIIPASSLITDASVHILRKSKNEGKGAAIVSAAFYAQAHQYHVIITLDADGQHLPSDLPSFIQAVCTNPYTLYIGVRNLKTDGVPFVSKFGRAFSNFWVRLQTGFKIQDSQSGFRAYPVKVITDLPCLTTSYAFEIEILVRALWAGVQVQHIPIRVVYSSPEKRVSHFRKFYHNLIISLLNTHLTGRSITPWPHRKLPPPWGTTALPKISILQPLYSIRQLLVEHYSPWQLMIATLCGIVIGALPIFGFHTVAIIFAANYLQVNKPAAIAASQLCMPPIIPFCCIELGHFLLHGGWLTQFDMHTLVYQAHYRLWEWLLGSLLIGPLLGLLMGGIVYYLANQIRNKIKPLLL